MLCNIFWEQFTCHRDSSTYHWQVFMIDIKFPFCLPLSYQPYPDEGFHIIFVSSFILILPFSYVTLTYGKELLELFLWKHMFSWDYGFVVFRTHLINLSFASVSHTSTTCWCRGVTESLQLFLSLGWIWGLHFLPGYSDYPFPWFLSLSPSCLSCHTSYVWYLKSPPRSEVFIFERFNMKIILIVDFLILYVKC